MLNLARSVFMEQQNLDRLVERILIESQQLLQCERCRIYVVEESVEGVSTEFFFVLS